MEVATLLFKLIAQQVSEQSVAELSTVTIFILCEEKKMNAQNT